MRKWLIYTCVLLSGVVNSVAWGQQNTKRFENFYKPSPEDFVTSKPAVGDPFPQVTIYDPDGQPFETGGLKGQYTLITLGCLTCPPFLSNAPELEAVYRDFQGKGVKFYFVYRSVAHPELRGNYLQTFTLDERLAHVRQASKQLGTSIPWLVDAMDNRLKHALGNRANCEYLIDPHGRVVRKRMWSDPVEVRKDLEALVGPAERKTRADELQLHPAEVLTETAPRGFIERLPRSGMWPLVTDPVAKPGNPPFYAKLRAEADLTLIDSGVGKLYLGFHLDPFYGVHWNKLQSPLRFEVTVPAEASFSVTSGTAQTIDAAEDCDPREFMIDVSKWPADKPVTVRVSYAACSEKECHVVQQEYVLFRERDPDGGRAAPAGFRGAMSPDEMISLMMKGDKDGDGKLKKDEVASLIRNSFDRFDTNRNGVLEKTEIAALAEENTRFLPGR